MAAQKKQNKEAVQQLETDIKTALTAFAKGVDSKKLHKKISKHSADLAELIVKLRQPAKKEKIKTAPPKKAKTKPAVPKKEVKKPVKKVIPPVKKK